VNAGEPPSREEGERASCWTTGAWRVFKLNEKGEKEEKDRKKN